LIISSVKLQIFDTLLKNLFFFFDLEIFFFSQFFEIFTFLPFFNFIFFLVYFQLFSLFFDFCFLLRHLTKLLVLIFNLFIQIIVFISTHNLRFHYGRWLSRPKILNAVFEFIIRLETCVHIFNRIITLSPFICFKMANTTSYACSSGQKWSFNDGFFLFDGARFFFFYFFSFVTPGDFGNFYLINILLIQTIHRRQGPLLITHHKLRLIIIPTIHSFHFIIS
jgi:hypothetical protein